MNNKNTIYFWGTTPPPLGGVTVFNSRKISELRTKGYDVILIKPSIIGLFKLCLLVFNRNYYIILSSSNILAFYIIFLFGLASKTIYYDHNASRDFNSEFWLNKFVRQKAISSFMKIMLVDGHLKNNYMKYPFFHNLFFEVESAFIPPDLNNEDSIIDKYPSAIKSLLTIKGNFIVIASAFKPNLGPNGEDIYNLSETINCFRSLSDEFPNLYFLFAIAHFDDTDFSRIIEKNINELLISRPNVLLLCDQNELWPLFKKSVLFIRPTTTDGDSISVRESLFFNCPVIASDVVPRPDGVILLNLKDSSLLSVIREHLSKNIPKIV